MSPRAKGRKTDPSIADAGPAALNYLLEIAAVRSSTQPRFAATGVYATQPRLTARGDGDKVDGVACRRHERRGCLLRTSVLAAHARHREGPHG